MIYIYWFNNSASDYYIFTMVKQLKISKMLHFVCYSSQEAIS